MGFSRNISDFIKSRDALGESCKIGPLGQNELLSYVLINLVDI